MTLDVVFTLMQANLLEVFNERDGHRRAAAIARTYTPTVRWSDDDGITLGREELAAKAAELRARFDGLEFVAVGDVQRTRGLGYLAWELRPVGTDATTASVAAGFDVALIADDRIAQLFTVVTSTS